MKITASNDVFTRFFSVFLTYMQSFGLISSVQGMRESILICSKLETAIGVIYGNFAILHKPYYLSPA
jgi:hypothetical protein